MVSLKQYLEDKERIVEQELLPLIPENFPSDGLFFSALAARLCVEKGTLSDLLSDSRVSDPEQRADFLLRLAKRKHYSVFAHSPIFLELPKDSKLPHLFKAFSIEKNDKLLVCLTARHVIELLVEFNLAKADFLIKKFVFHYPPKWVSVMYPHTQVSLFVGPISPWQWCVFHISRISRVASHQLVRHTWQNFNQQSFRYTPVNLENFFTPPGAVMAYKAHPNLRETEAKLLTQTADFIEQLRAAKVPNEDVRYYAPNGVCSQLITSGPRFVFEDFIQKRKTKAAQFEIMQLAILMENLIKEVWG